MLSPGELEPWIARSARAPAAGRTPRWPSKRASPRRPSVIEREVARRVSIEHMAANGLVAVQRRPEVAGRRAAAWSRAVRRAASVTRRDEVRSPLAASSLRSRLPGGRNIVTIAAPADGRRARATIGAPWSHAGGPVGDDGVLGYDQPQARQPQLEAVGQLRGVDTPRTGAARAGASQHARELPIGRRRARAPGAREGPVDRHAGVRRPSGRRSVRGPARRCPAAVRADPSAPLPVDRPSGVATTPTRRVDASPMHRSASTGRRSSSRRRQLRAEPFAYVAKDSFQSP